MRRDEILRALVLGIVIVAIVLFLSDKVTSAVHSQPENCRVTVCTDHP